MLLGSTLSRRSLLKAGAVAGLAGTVPALGARRAAAAGTATVGFVYVGPKNDFGFNQSHAQSVNTLRSTRA